jgi:tRNA-binding protein
LANEAVTNQHISWDEFTQVELRVGKILQASDLPNARKPAYLLQIDFGLEIGVKKSSSQITDYYTKEELIGRQVVAVINFPKKQIGSIQSECLVTGFYDESGKIILCVPDKEVPLGSKLL